MLALIPYEIETLQQERPWANWLIIALCSVFSLSALSGDALYEGEYDQFILDGWSLPGLFTHVALHGGILHLVGNMIFLWVFGNAICSNIGNIKYLVLFVLLTLFSAAVHNVMDGYPAIGASGAINGVVGFVFALYPLNRVYLFWLFLIKGGSVACKAWIIIIAWLLFDIWGVISGGGMIAYWAHIGGFAGGTLLGLAALQFDWIRLTDCDNRCLLELIKGETWE